MATRKRHSPEQIVRKLMAADRLLAEGKDTAAVCRELGMSEATYHRWRNQFGGLKAEDAKRFKDLERENATLKRLLADAELEKDALRADNTTSQSLLSQFRRRFRCSHADQMTGPSTDSGLGPISSAGKTLSVSHPSPIRAARMMAGSACVPIHIGGPGSWAGLGQIPASATKKCLPDLPEPWPSSCEALQHPPRVD
jgi:putative transposase